MTTIRDLCFGAALCALADAAQAATTPAYGPPPAWVKPLSVPAVPTKTDAPVRLLLSDEQIDFSHAGLAHYGHLALVIQTAAGLPAANLVLPWRPDIDALTIHTLAIHRGPKTINILADQKFAIIRREQNLEAATIDGRLSATMQIAGVEVGDVVELEMTTVSRDPTLGDHAEAVFAQWNGTGFDHVHARLHWPKEMTLRFRSSEGLPPLKTVADSNGKTVELNAEDLKPLIAPKGAPARFGYGRRIEASDYQSWSDPAAVMAPLYAKAALIDDKGPLAAQIGLIRSASIDPKERAAAALSLVQDKIRYVALLMGASGYVPAAADATWASKLGDCKAKTAMLLAILHRLDIAAVPALVSSQQGDGLDQSLPMIGAFDHVLVRATIAGKDYWLDGTRVGDRDLDSLEIPAFRWALPVVARGSKLVRLMPDPPSRPYSEFQVGIDASAGIFAPAPSHVDVLYRGDAGQSLKASLAAMPEATRDQTLREYFKGIYDFIEPTKVAAGYDSATGVEKISLDGTATLKWENSYFRIPGSSLSFNADFSRTAGPGHDVPFALDYPSYYQTTTSIKLPPRVTLWPGKVGHDVDQTLAEVRYHREAVVRDGTLTLTKWEKTLVPEVSAAEARAAQARLRSLNDEDVHLQNFGYIATDADLVALASTAPDNASAFADRGQFFADRRRYKQAVADFTQALAMTPKDVTLLAKRSAALFADGQLSAAEADLKLAETIDPGNEEVARARANLQSMSDDKLLMANLNAAIAKNPKDAKALESRAQLHYQAGEYAAALNDTDKWLAIAPTDVDAHLLRANILTRQGKPELALAEGEITLNAKPGDSEAAAAAAKIFAKFGKRERSLSILDNAIAAHPSALLYLNRADVRAPTDLVGSRADIDAALKLEPDSEFTLSADAYFLLDHGKPGEAVSRFTKLIALYPDDAGLVMRRGIAYARAGDADHSGKDFAAATKKAATPTDQNNLCWLKAMENVALDTALEDCNRALIKEPAEPAYLDSRGLVNLRLGRLDAAIADYDSALKLQPRQAASLYGRAIAWSRKGDKTKAAVDRTAAVSADANVVSEFKHYGLNLD